MGRRLSTPEWRLCVSALQGAASGGDGVLRVGCPLCERMRGRADAKKSLYCHADGGFSCFRCGAVGSLPGSQAATERRLRAGLGDGHHAPHRTSHTLDAPAAPYPPGVPPAAPGLRGAVAVAALWAPPPWATRAAPLALPVPVLLPRPGAATTPAPASPPPDPSALAAARIAHGFEHDPRPEWVPPAGVVALAAAGAPLYAWQVPPVGFRALYGPGDAAAADALDGGAFDDTPGEAAPPLAPASALGWAPDPADVDAAPEALAAARARALAPFRRYVETRRARADDTEGLDRAVVMAAGLGACVSGPLAGYIVAPVWAPVPPPGDGQTAPHGATPGGAWWGWVARLVVPHPDPARAAQQPTYRFAPGMPWHVYLDGEDILDTRTDVPAFVVEGFFDRLHLYPDGVATLSKPTTPQLERLARSRRPVVFIPDGDAWEAAVYHAAMLRARGVPSGVVRLPPQVDPDEVPEGVLRDAGWLAVRSAEPVYLAACDDAGDGGADAAPASLGTYDDGAL